MKAVILAAGQSSRFWPLSQEHHKSFYRVGSGKSVLEYTVANLLGTNLLDQIIVVVSQCDHDIAVACFSDNPIVTIVVQENPTGEGDALLVASELLKHNDRFFLTVADKIYAHHILQKLLDHQEAIAIRETDQPQHYGIVELDHANKITAVYEKPSPAQTTSHKRITSGYLLQTKFLDDLKTFAQDHYNLETCLDQYCKKSTVHGVAVDDVADVTLKFPWHLLSLNRLVMADHLKPSIHPSAKIGKTSIIDGPVFIGENVTIYEFVKITGPVYIGKNSTVGDYTSIRDSVFIDANVMVGSKCEVKNTIAYQGVSFHQNFIGDSIIDANCKIGAGTVTANRRHDRSTIKSEIKGAKVDSGLTYFGCVLGTNALVGVNCSIMPGVKIGSSVSVWPHTCVYSDIIDNETHKGSFA